MPKVRAKARKISRPTATRPSLPRTRRRKPRSRIWIEKPGRMAGLFVWARSAPANAGPITKGMGNGAALWPPPRFNKQQSGLWSRLPPGRSLWPGDDRKRFLKPYAAGTTHRSAVTRSMRADGGSGGRGRRLTTASRLYRRRGLPARMPQRRRRDLNDGTGAVAGVASVVILVQETRELLVVEPAPACVQAAQEFELAACE